jgi:rRNA maturation RNase YbeY
MAIVFNTEAEGFKLNNKTALKNWVKQVVLSHKKKCGNIQYVFVNDEALLLLNQQYLNHQTLTDIITFDYSEENIIHGDIYISCERVAENAKKFKVNIDEELHRVMIHGVLHLCGFKDKSAKDAEKMRMEENRSLAKRTF